MNPDVTISTLKGRLSVSIIFPTMTRIIRKTVGFPLEDWKGLTVDGQGADFIFHGRMLPLSLLRSEDCILRNFSIDFETPHITQVKVLKSGEEGITFEPVRMGEMPHQ